MNAMELRTPKMRKLLDQQPIPIGGEVMVPHHLDNPHTISQVDSKMHIPTAALHSIRLFQVEDAYVSSSLALEIYGCYARARGE